MTTWLETAKAVLVGTFKHPNETTVVTKDKQTGRVSSYNEPPKVTSQPHPNTP